MTGQDNSTALTFSGTHEVPLGQQQLWEALNDPDILQQCINRCEEVVRDGDYFKACFNIGLGPFSRRFDARLTVTDAHAPDSYQLHCFMDAGWAGEISGSADVFLTEVAEHLTRVDYAATVRAAGWLGEMGQKLLGHTAHKYMNRFFERLVEAAGHPGLSL